MSRFAKIALPVLCAAAGLSLAPVAAGSTVQDQLELQYQLGNDVPLRNTPWIGTHNSFNSSAEMGQTLSDQDSNQKVTLVEQLDAGMRSLELDIHTFVPASSGGDGPVVCHARGEDQGHLGCSVEKRLDPVLREIVGWLDRPENREVVLMLYLENHIDDEAGHNEAAAVIDEVLGSRLYRPPAGGCTELPFGMSRGEMVRSGAQAFIVTGSCGEGAAWQSTIFTWEDHREERPFSYADYPDCGPDFERADYQAHLIRYYEDSTQLTATVGTPDEGIPPSTAAAMARCGVDLIGFDQLTGASDPRLPAVVWSWAPGEPRNGKCALMAAGDDLPTGRWFSRPCGKTRRRVACRTDAGKWLIPKKTAKARAGRFPCNAKGARYGVPRTGYEMQTLVGAMKKAKVRAVWIGYRRASGRWWALDPPVGL